MDRHPSRLLRSHGPPPPCRPRRPGPGPRVGCGPSRLPSRTTASRASTSPGLRRPSSRGPSAPGPGTPDTPLRLESPPRPWPLTRPPAAVSGGRTSGASGSRSSSWPRVPRLGYSGRRPRAVHPPQCPGGPARGGRSGVHKARGRQGCLWQRRSRGAAPTRGVVGRGAPATGPQEGPVPRPFVSRGPGRGAGGRGDRAGGWRRGRPRRDPAQGRRGRFGGVVNEDRPRGEVPSRPSHPRQDDGIPALPLPGFVSRPGGFFRWVPNRFAIARPEPPRPGASPVLTPHGDLADPSRPYTGPSRVLDP